MSTLLATLMLLGIVPLGIFNSERTVGEMLQAGGETSSPVLPRRRVSFGSPFPSLPVTISLGKGLGNYGFRFDIQNEQGAPPVLIYWSRALDQDGIPSGEVTFLGIVGGTENSWVSLPQHEMRHRGFLSIYAFHNGRTETHNLDKSMEEKFE